jgi:hypothetical protein
MKIQRIVSPPMRLQNFPALCIAILATHAACVAAPAPAESPDALPDFRTTPAKTPAKDADKALPLGAPRHCPHFYPMKSRARCVREPETRPPAASPQADQSQM